MQSKFEFVYYPNGNSVTKFSKGDRLYAGQVGTAEYYLKMANENDDNNWREDDFVFIAFEKPNRDVINQKMNYKDGKWRYVSNGWETDLDNIDVIQKIKVSFICRRYSADKRTVATKTTEQCNVCVHPSKGYTYLETIDGGAAEDFLHDVQAIETEFVRFKENSILIDQAIAEAKTLQAGKDATVEIARQNEQGKTLFSFGIPQGHTISEIISGEPEVTKEKTITPLTAVRTDGEQLEPFTISAQNGRDGNGVFALEIEDGNLVIYSEQVDNADFIIEDDGQLTVVLKEVN